MPRCNKSYKPHSQAYCVREDGHPLPHELHNNAIHQYGNPTTLKFNGLVHIVLWHNPLSKGKHYAEPVRKELTTVCGIYYRTSSKQPRKMVTCVECIGGLR